MAKARTKRKVGAAKARSKSKTAKPKRAAKRPAKAGPKTGLFGKMATAAAWVGSKVRATVKRSSKKKKPKAAKAKPAPAAPVAPPVAPLT